MHLSTRPKTGWPSLIQLLALFVMLCDTALGQRPPVVLDTIQTVATRVQGGPGTQTRSVEVLSRERIRSMPAATVVQALTWALGIDLAARSAAQADLSIRGSSYEQVLVLVNGVPVSDPQTGHFDLDLTIPLARVERIEILRGPASTLYGADAMGGVVNIVTRAPSTHVEGRVEGGSYGSVSGSLAGGFRAGGTRVAGAAGYGRSDGHRPGTDHTGGQVQLEASSALFGGNLSTQAGQSWKDFGAADFYAPFPSYEETRTATLAASWRGPVARDLELQPRIYWRRHRDYFVLDRADPAFYSNRHTSGQAGAEVTARYRHESGLTIAFGTQVGRDAIESTNLGDRSQERWAVFAESETSTGPLTVNLGMRVDHYENFGSFPSPSLSAGLRGRRLRVRGSVARSFRAPTWTERYYEDPLNRGRPDLEPERAWTEELGADWQMSGSARFSLTAFRRSASALIDWARPVNDSTGSWEARNVESATFHGLEAELSGIGFAGAKLAAQGSLLSMSSVEADGYVSKYALRPLTRDVAVRVERIVGPVTGITRVSNRRRAGEADYWLVDLRLAVSLRVGEFYLDMLNGLHSDYADITGAPAAGRSIRLGYRIER